MVNWVYCFDTFTEQWLHSLHQSPDQVMQELYKAARNAGESKVIWQVVPHSRRMQPFIDTFEKKFPGIKSQRIQLSGSEAPARIVTRPPAKEDNHGCGRGSPGKYDSAAGKETLPLSLIGSYRWVSVANLLHLDNGFFGNSHDA